MEILKNQQLYVNQSKCCFAQRQLEYLGHFISEGVAADKSKIEAVLRWPTQKTLHDLQGFLGLTGCYRKFVAGYSKIAWPLTEQLKKNNFGWNEAADEAFHKLKLAMTNAPVLALPDFVAPFDIETNASRYGLGAVIMQGQQPLAFYSHALPAQARCKSIYEHELMAIAVAVQKWATLLDWK